MKVIVVAAVMSLTCALRMPGDELLSGSVAVSSDENVTKPKGEEWNSYVQARGQHDCAINELRNWFGSSRCIESFECQGARLCEGGSKKLGWCSGDSNCPNMGPLDYHDEKGEIVWNQGKQGTWDQESTIDLPAASS